MPVSTEGVEGGGLLIAYTKLLGDVVWKSLTIDDNVHRLTLDKVVRGIPYPLVLTCFSPRVLYEEELATDLVLSHPIDHHTMVIG